VIEDREVVRRLDADALIATCVGKESNSAEILVRSGILCVKASGHMEAIYKRRKPAAAIRVRKKMECLETLRKGYQM
jgi:hypothetical protein